VEGSWISGKNGLGGTLLWTPCVKRAGESAGLGAGGRDEQGSGAVLARRTAKEIQAGTIDDSGGYIGWAKDKPEIPIRSSSQFFLDSQFNR
jgi:hypothetical protein